MFREEHEVIRNADNSHTITPDSGSNDVAKESAQRLTIEERLAGKMFSYARKIICFFLAIMFTALAALHSSPPKVSKPPLARPFFNQNSVVLDFYKGHLGAMIERVAAADFSFVMYYAPWDAESQMLRQEFEKVALSYHNQIFFAAINCWHPNSECRAYYNNIQSYPVLMLYPSRDSGIQYKGIRTAPYMIHFLSTVMNPIVRVADKEQLKELLVNYYAVVVGYFNFTRLDRTPGYREFYKAAVRALEGDPNGVLVFAIVTDALSSKLDHDVVKFPSAKFLIWGESTTYPEDSEWTSENILKWINSFVQYQPAFWLQPPGIKALTLAPYLRKGPVLFLFTPRNPLHSENYNYNLLREIGLQYHYCSVNPFVKDIITRLEQKRRTAIARHLKRNKECNELLKKNKNQSNKSTVSISIEQWINDSCCANIVMNKCAMCKRSVMISEDKKDSVCTLVSDKSDHVCKGADIFKVPTIDDQQEKYEVCCNRDHVSLNLQGGFKSPSLHNKVSFTTENDLRSANAVRQAYFKKECQKWKLGNYYHQPIFPKDSVEHPNINLTNSICKTNRTVQLIAIDSLNYFHFAEGLGIDVLRKKDKTAVVILDPAHESQYVMHGDFNLYTLVQFINNYTEGFLQRTLRSNNSRRFAQKFKTNYNCEKQSARSVCVPELTTETFLDTILDPTKDVVVMYHSPYCGFCNAISYVYLTVAHYLREMSHLLFVRVDGDNNDLPWEYNMNRFPSILFFPAKRKEDSTVYPFSLPITIPNLINFVLANLNGDSHVEALVNICQSGTGEPPDRCIARTRWLCLDIGQQLLRDYRKLMRQSSFLDRRTVRNKRKLILLKLEHIKEIYFILASTVNLREDQHLVKMIRKKYEKYYARIALVELGSKVNSGRTRNSIREQNVNARNKLLVKTEL